MAGAAKTPLKIILGAASVGDKATSHLVRYETADEVNALLEVFAAHGHHQIDSARAYPASEDRLGEVNAADKFVIDTKINSQAPGRHTKENILAEIDISLKLLKTSQINIEYLHVPDRATSFVEPCEAMDQAHREGKIKHWGLCNYRADEVQQILNICEQRGFVKPSVYQGHYNAIVRGGEKDLFPLLHANKMPFYAFSAAGGGFFAGNHKNVQSRGRFDESSGPGALYASLYLKPPVIAATEKAVAVAAKHGIGGHAAALRWTAYHSVLDKTYGDAIILAGSTLQQMEANLNMVEQGPLPQEVVDAFNVIFGEIGEDGISYHL